MLSLLGDLCFTLKSNGMLNDSMTDRTAEAESLKNLGKERTNW